MTENRKVGSSNVSARKSCERAYRWPAWRLSAATPMMALLTRVYPGGGGCAQVRRSSGLTFPGRNRSSGQCGHRCGRHLRLRRPVGGREEPA